MHKLIELALRRHWLVAVAFLLISAFGVYSWTQLAIDAYPDIADVTVQVVTQVPGLAAEEIEQQITIPLERSLNGIPSLGMMRSKNAFGLSIIILVFEDGTEDYWARQRVRECIGDVDLPYEAVPELNPLTSPTGEIYRYILESDNHTLRELTDLNHWVIIPRLQQIPGVAAVSNYGGLTTQYQLEIDPNLLLKYGLSLGDVEDALAGNNANSGGSMLTSGDVSYVVRGVGLIEDLEDLGRVVVKSVDGSPVYLSDLGELKYGNLERKGVLGFVDDETSIEDGVEGIVQMLRYQNPSKVLEQVHAAVDELNSDVLPKGVRIRPFMDRTELVGTTLSTVEHTLFFGMLLVIGILLIFLGSPLSALIVAATIPISLLVAFILMHLTGIPANLLSLGAIDFGILVDGAIVMTETLLKLREEAPDKPLDARRTIRRIADVAKPIFFSTIIIIVAYMPLFSFERIEKKLFTPMAYTVGYALLGALSVALILIPGLAYSLYRKPQKVYRNKVMESLTEKYKRSTDRVMDRPKGIFAGIAVILVLVGVLATTVGKDFLPALDEGGIWIQIQAPPGISLAKSTQMASDLRERMKQFDEVTYVMTQVGRDDEGAEAFTSSHIECCIGLKPYSSWKWGKTKADLVEEMAAAINGMPGYRAGFSQPIIDMVMDQIAGSHSDLAVKVYGDDLTEARRIAEDVMAVVSDIPGATDVIIDQEPPLPQLKITADRESIAQYGLNVSDIADLIEVAIGGKAISQVFIGSKVYDVICRFTEESRDTPEKIAALTLMSSDGVPVPLSAVAEVKTVLGASSITREMNKRHLTVRLNLRGRDLTSYLEEARARIAKEVEYDHTAFQVRWDGQFENQRRAYRRLAVIIPFVLAIMFLLLFGAFGKFRQAGLLISLLPLALLGGLLALNVRGMTFNVSSAVGFIALFGLTIQNGVIMISHINSLRRDGAPLRKAVVEGAAHRLRPVLMTATVAILGLLPASLATGIGSDVQRPLATVIVYGLLFSTIITLYILPTLYYLMERRHEDKNVKSDEEYL
ncbi:MAG: CusA/CzcA family heavy metal efflux RND transporter [Bacteroidales bacterium]|nr:CusA/CzcA family heavy metal efflux RND transporter [Bacteroidales bacterium]